MKSLIQLKQKQSGAVLMVGLLIIVVLTVIGVSAVNTSIMGEKISGNQRNKEIAFQAAESALRDGEQWTTSLISIPKGVTSCDNAPCDLWNANSFSDFHKKSDSWWQSTARPFSTTISGANSQPLFIIEIHSFVPYDLSPEARSKGFGYHYYRVTSKGSGGTDEAQSVVQTIYATQFN